MQRKNRPCLPTEVRLVEIAFSGLCETGMVLSNPQTACASATTVFLKGPGRGDRIVRDLRAVNQLCESVPVSMVNLEQIAQLCAVATVSFTLNILRSYWQCPLRQDD